MYEIRCRASSSYLPIPKIYYKHPCTVRVSVQSKLDRKQVHIRIGWPDLSDVGPTPYDLGHQVSILKTDVAPKLKILSTHLAAVKRSMSRVGTQRGCLVPDAHSAVGVSLRTWTAFVWCGLGQRK